MRFVAKPPAAIEAEQWFPGVEIPNVCGEGDCRVRPSGRTDIHPHVHVSVCHTLMLKPGDWIFRRLRAGLRVLSAKEMARRFDPAPDEDGFFAWCEGCFAAITSAEVNAKDYGWCGPDGEGYLCKRCVAEAKVAEGGAR